MSGVCGHDEGELERESDAQTTERAVEGESSRAADKQRAAGKEAQQKKRSEQLKDVKQCVGQKRVGVVVWWVCEAQRV